MFVDIYFGMFKVKEVHAIKKSMTKHFTILLDRIAPPSVTFTLTEQEDKVTLVIKEAQDNQEARSQIMTPRKPDMEEAGEEDVFRKVQSDLKDHNIPEEEIRKKMDELNEKAKSEFK